MSGLYLHLSKRNDNVERAAEASPSTLGVMRRAVLRRPFLTRTFLARSLAILTLAATATACDDPGPVAPTPTTATPVSFTETFTGTLARNGAVTFPFEALAAGTATATMAALVPVIEPIGFAMGTWNGLGCQTVISNDSAFQFATLTGTVGGPGRLCLRVYDVGGVATTVKFTVSVTHF